MWNGPIEKIDDYRWMIPKEYKPGMKVPGVLFADEALLKDIRQDKAAEQVANVACLPGIVKASLAMPDIHWGFGFPIGGVAATDIEQGGVICPGGIGYDINCLCGSTSIGNELGYKIRIKDYENIFRKARLRCMNFSTEREEAAGIVRFLKQKPRAQVLEIITETDRHITATEDHPFYTKDGMVPAGDLAHGDSLAVSPYEGVDYEEPDRTVLVDEDKVREVLGRLGKGARGNSDGQIIGTLRKRELLPLRLDSPQLPYLLKLLGYCFGDGTLLFLGKGKKGTTCFYGQPEDLKKIRADLETLGFRSGLYCRRRHHRIVSSYGVREFDCREYRLNSSSNSLAVIFAALGMPIGNKCRQAYELPQWLYKAPLWQKRLFLAGLFGAELSSPQTLTNAPYNFYCPTLSMNKTVDHLESGRVFLEGLAALLSEFGISVYRITQRRENVSKEGGASYRLRLMMSVDTDNLIKLYSKVGYEYSRKRALLAQYAAGYLRFKQHLISQRQEAAHLAPQLYASGNWGRNELFCYMRDTLAVRERFVTRSLYEPRKTAPRFWRDQLCFKKYIERNTIGLGKSGMVWERIKSITPVEYHDYVYDFTVDHDHHNFIANNFVVSNCGVRLVSTDLDQEEVMPRLRELVYALFNDVPSGVGSKGQIRLGPKDQKDILVKGAGWAVGKGYGTPEDLRHTEEEGALAGADPQAVSERAFERGKAQSGTLGSGNHFLEIQVIDQLFERDAVDLLGLREGQVMVMIHSGSRGLGYQVCDDYVRRMGQAMHSYGITVPDRQLACVPVDSQEGRAYLGAMRAAANYAWANRQCLMHLVREAFAKVLGRSWQKLGMRLIYDVAHNIAKIETHEVDGKKRSLCVHRKGATRAFGPHHPELPGEYKPMGQPVIIPGDMGRNSYLLAGTQTAMQETFGSTCHGAGRLKSRSAAVRSVDLNRLLKQLESKGIIVQASGKATLVEEAPEAYKDVNDVVRVVHNAGLARRVCRMRPLGVVKG